MKIVKSLSLVSISLLTLFMIFGCDKDSTGPTDGTDKSLIVASTRIGKYAIIDPETGNEIAEPTPGTLIVIKPCLGYLSAKAFFLSHEQGIGGSCLFGCDAQTGASQYKLISQTNINLRDVDGSPVAQKLAFSGILSTANRNYVFIINEDGSNLTQITNVDELMTLPNTATEVKLQSGGGPAWSPDGAQIGFFSGVRESITNLVHSCVVVMNSDGSNKQILYSKPVEEAHYRDACWTNDGSFLMFSVEENGRKVKAINLASNTVSDITNAMDTGDAVEYFCTAPNEMKIVFNHRNDYHLKTVNLTANGNNLSASGSTAFASTHAYTYPDWAGWDGN